MEREKMYHNNNDEEVLRSAAIELLMVMHSMGFIPELTNKDIEKIMPSLGFLRSMPLDFRRKMALTFANTLSKRGKTEGTQAHLGDHIQTAIMRSLDVPSETPNIS